MKKLIKFLTASTLLLLAFSGYLGYTLYKIKHPPAPAQICPVSYDYNNGDPVGIINYETAQALYENYQNDRGKAFISGHDATGKLDGFIPDTKSVWFSLDRLKNFIWHIENQNCSKPCHDTLGLRIYFAKYPDLSKLSDQNLLGLDEVPKEYSNQHTLFMVPTYKGKDGYDYDFYPDGKDCRTPIDKSPLIEVGQGEIKTMTHALSPIFLFDLNTGTTSGSQNHGGLVPPNDPTGTSFQK
jgi:hypothetical protein